MRQSNQTSKSISNSLVLFLTGVCLALGATVGILQLVNAVHRESGEPILWLALLSFTLIFGSSMCLFFALAAFLKSRQPLPEPISHSNLVLNGEYVAEYSRSDRVKALFIVGFFGASTTFLLLRSAKPTMIALFATILVWAVSHAVHVMTTRIVFTHQGFVARLPWYRELREPYDHVQRISGRPQTVRVEFSDGRVLKFHPGLGDPDAVISHLQARCPKSVQME